MQAVVGYPSPSLSPDGTLHTCRVLALLGGILPTDGHEFWAPGKAAGIQKRDSPSYFLRPRVFSCGRLGLPGDISDVWRLFWWIQLGPGS